MSEIPPAIPFHLARTYGVPTPTLVAGRRTLLPATPADAGMRQAPARMPSKVVSRLVAARVRGAIDFTEGAPQPARAGASAGATAGTGRDSVAPPAGTPERLSNTLAPDGALAFYRHPADKNAAATSIAHAGRVLDTTA